MKGKKVFYIAMFFAIIFMLFRCEGRDSREYLEERIGNQISRVYPTKNLEDLFVEFPNGFTIYQSYLLTDKIIKIELDGTEKGKPIEGTILTVIREISEGLKEQVLSNTTIEEAFENIVKLARQSCDKTPELLSILKEVGVTDSGGEGLYAILEGMNAYFHGKPVTQNDGVETIDKFISDSEVYSG